MNSSDMEPIGGYFGIELRHGGFLHDDSALLTSGRACFEYVLRAADAARVYLPKFTCDVMLEPLQRLGIPHEFYAIDDKLAIAQDITLQDGEYLVYTNYFGVTGSYARQLAERYGDRLIIDNSQALYADPVAGCHTFYSPRKFFGLPDGGCLYSPLQLEEDLPVGVSYRHASHLLRRIDEGAEAGYADFKQNDALLSGQPLSRMSNLTRALLGNIDFAAARERRNANFALLHERLGGQNMLQFDMRGVDAPLCYPFRVNNAGLRQKFISRKIFVATYWPNVLEWCKPEELAYQLTESILPLPIDQRYGEAEMQRILQVIYE